MARSETGWAKVANLGSHHFQAGQALSACGHVVGWTEPRTSRPARGGSCAACREALKAPAVETPPEPAPDAEGDAQADGAEADQ